MKDLDLQSEKIGSRLKAIRNSLKLTVEEFYGPVMKSFNNGSSIENNKRRLGKRLAKDIIEYHRINPVFLSQGTGRMLLNTGSDRKETSLPQTRVSESMASVPYYDIGLAGFEQASPDVFSDSAPEYYVDYRPLNDCSAYLPVYGDSMHPRFSAGEIIAVKEITNPDVILWGEAYLLFTDKQANNLIAIRLLHQHDHPDKIILRAANPDYGGDTVISKSSIKRLYLVKGKITQYQL